MSDPNAASRFGEIYDSTNKAVLAFITSKCGRTADISDIFQDTYMELYKTLCERGAEYVTNEKALVLRIAKRKVARYYSLLDRLRIFVSMTTVNEDGDEVDMSDLEADSFMTEDFTVNHMLLETVRQHIASKTNGWSFNDDSESVYVNVWLKCEGENIKNVEFFTAEGFFAKQYIKRENGDIIRDDVPMGAVGTPSGGYTIVHYGNNYERVGNSLILNADEMTDDLLLFWGRESRRVGHDLNLPSELTFRAVATFNDGKTQEETVVIDLSPPFMGSGIIKLTKTRLTITASEDLIPVYTPSLPHGTTTTAATTGISRFWKTMTTAHSPARHTECPAGWF